MNLDAFDDDLLEHFDSRFPKPDRIELCELDVRLEEARLACQSRLFETDLAPRFASNNRLGLLGDCRDFPAFAAELMVFCRRARSLHECDLAFFFLHSLPAGAFSEEDRGLVGAWVDDVLMPWRRPIERSDPLGLPEHALSYLALVSLLGGDPCQRVGANLDRLSGSDSPPLLVSLRPALDRRGRVRKDVVRRHFQRLNASSDNQDLPVSELVAEDHVVNCLEAVAASTLT